jgi:hypothetical protein
MPLIGEKMGCGLLLSRGLSRSDSKEAGRGLRYILLCITLDGEGCMPGFAHDGKNISTKRQNVDRRA